MVELAMLRGITGLGPATSASAVRRWPAACPSGGADALEVYELVRAHPIDGSGTQLPVGSSTHACACRAGLRRHDDGGLIPEAAFDAGARTALPEATVVQDGT